MINKLIVLRFWIKMLCIIVFGFYIDDLPNFSLDPTLVSLPMIRQRVRSNPCVESLIDNGGQTMCLVDVVDVNANASKCTWIKKAFG